MAPVNVWEQGMQLLSRVKTFAAEQERVLLENPLALDALAPPISRTTATALAVAFTILYISPFYTIESLKVSSKVSRDSPASIKARTRAVLLICLACLVITVFVLAIVGHVSSPYNVLHLLGFYPFSLRDMAKCLGLVVVLFAGPLFEEGVVDGNWKYWYRPSHWKSLMIDDWTGWRNLVVGPISEELVFRSYAIALYLLARDEPKNIVLATPLLFGLAHLHHFNEFIVEHQTPSRSYLATLTTPSIFFSGLFRTLFQLFYTSLFGMFVAFVFLRTGSLWTCIVIHGFCNWQGVPRFWGRVGEIVSDETLPEGELKRSDDGPLSGQTVYSHGLIWTVVYYALIVGGSFGFYKLLWPATESRYALASMR